jgi:phage tail sheath protein FI
MPANFLHGVETIDIPNQIIPISVVKSAVVGLVGIAPKGALNQLILVQNQVDAASLGSQLPGFSIPQALDAIFKQGAGTVLVVNVFDPTAHTTAVTAESVTVLNRTTKMAFAPVGATAPLVTHTSGTPTYVSGTDYTIDDFGTITILAPIVTIAESAVLKVTYAKLNASAITATLINGTIDATTTARSGFKCYVDSYNNFGFKPKIFIAPNYSSLNTVSNQMIVESNNYNAFALIDAPPATTVPVAITGRGPSGAINFNTSDKRAILCYPMVKSYDVATNSIINKPYSQFLAGVMCANDYANGYWFSPSNKEIKGIVGLERNISAAINDASTDANLLNANGIETVFNSFGTGFRTWGNRSAAFPTSTAPSNFIAVQRTADIISESVELASLNFVDQPINNGLIDSIRESVNSFIRTLIGRGALLNGSECTYDASLNPPTQLALGQIVFTINMMPPTPAERITFNRFIDIKLLSQLGTTA